MNGRFSITTRPRPYGFTRTGKIAHKTGTVRGTHGFTAVDGEGITVRGQHRYALLGVADQQIEDSLGLGLPDIFSFIYEHNKPAYALTGFYLGYDFNQWFRCLPAERAWYLFTTEGQAKRRRINKKNNPNWPKNQAWYHPVEFKDWQFDLLGTRRLKFRPKLCDCKIVSCKCTKAHWCYVNDAGPFFQTSFLNVINPEKWPGLVTPEEFAIVVEGKSRRSVARLDDDMRRYNLLENQLFERVMPHLDKGLRNLNVYLTPRQWFGPGQAAQEWMRNRAHKRSDIENAIPRWFLDAARASYIAGWFELFAHGLIPGISHEYDLNSAYPFIIADLPCLLHGTYDQGQSKTWTDIRDDPEAACIYMVRAYLSAKRGSPVGAALHRDRKGRILRPLRTEGWFWAHEIKAAEKAGCITQVNVKEWASFLPGCDHKPLAEMAGLYQLRLDVGKKTPLGRGARLVYNSGYGKLAQSVGDPMYANPVHASLITAGCRTMILNAIATHPGGVNAVIMVATDGVYFLAPHPGLAISDQLGEWDHAEHSNLTLFKPGVYWDDKTRDMITRGETPEFKARGINAADMAASLASIDTQFASWEGRPPPVSIMGHPSDQWPAVTFRPSFAMTTCLQALRRNDWTQAGHVTIPGKPVTQSSCPIDKRESAWYEPSTRIYRTRPYLTGTNGLISRPYQKTFGMENPFSDEYKSQHGLTPDGYAGEEYRDILMGD